MLSNITWGGPGGGFVCLRRGKGEKIHKFVQVLSNITWGGGGGLSASGGTKVKKYTNLYRCSVI